MNNLGLQLEWEAKYNNSQEYKLLQEDFMTLLPEEMEPREKKIFGIILTQVYLHKRIDIPSLVGIIVDKCQSAEEASDFIIEGINKGLVKYDPSKELLLVKYEPEEEVIKRTEQFMFPPPLLCKPNPINTNKDSAYYSIKTDNIILNQKNLSDNMELDACLDHINNMNQIQFKLNLKVAETIHNHWEGTLHPKEGESEEDFQKKVRAFQKYDRNAHYLISLIKEAGNKFYLAHHYDKRGRIYSLGYYINYQGNDWCKASIEFAEEEYLQ